MDFGRLIEQERGKSKSTLFFPAGGCGAALCHNPQGTAAPQCGDDNCASNPCEHGVCTNTGDKEYECFCPRGLWEGENCADDVDNCVTQKGDLIGAQYGGEHLAPSLR